ncbi:carotenoid oxygenase [Aaosphaeria arxii CBS 175.79]|uniref:Carotenoid oxygenase n=1 Tax=Aaosphaeria arxii CBS 175.79 TaxID=1450172 RepID=A0A6A5XD58_9PLEO|nr:carotenoid oxygenase [Aaosphaeria arxii CBS 175.79]KAF2010737.1 carotenoid oxygenase [Aaosphaeria arxii CBS 175.79]
MSTIVGKRKRKSEHPYLTGNFAPVTDTFQSTPCSYIGSIPSELLGGQYVRNGGNPVSNSDLGRDAHWFDGDGMLAGVLFKRSSSGSNRVTPHFVNQYILTDVCLSSFENTNLRTPILPSIATLVSPIASLIVILIRIFRSIFLVLLSHLPGSQQAIKRISVANTGIIYHDGRALATCESGPPMRVRLPGLETVGWYDGKQAEGEEVLSQGTDEQDARFGGKGVLSFMKEWTTGHPKVDPCTGEMLLFHCTFVAPYVHYSVIPRERKPGTPLPNLLNAPVPGCSGGKMMHDFGVSRNNTVILDLPLTLTPFNLLRNHPVVCFEPNSPARFGVFPRRQPEKVKWFETDGCCIFHTANTWDENDAHGNTAAVNLLTCRLTSASLVFSAGNLTPPPHPHRKEVVTKRPRMSFFAKYDLDDDIDNTEKLGELEPLLSEQRHAKVAYDATPPCKDPPISSDDEEQCRLYYYRFSLDSPIPTVTHQYALSSIPFEFPTLNPAVDMSAAKYIYGCSTSHESFGAALGKATKIDVLVKMDVLTLLTRAQNRRPEPVTGCVDTRSISQIFSSAEDQDPIKAFRMPDGWYAQEARFVSRDKPESEDDGYLLFYAFNEAQLNRFGECPEGAVSELWIIDAKNMQDIIARISLPQRVPYGLHGNWFTEDQIRLQRPVELTRTMPVDKPKTLWSKIKGTMIAASG